MSDDIFSDESNFLDPKSKEYASVVYEMALSDGDQDYVMQETGIGLNDFNTLLASERFQKSLEDAKAEINAEGLNPVALKAKIFSHIAINALNEIVRDTGAKDQDRLSAIKMMLEISGVINKNKEEQSTIPTLTINIQDYKKDDSK